MRALHFVFYPQQPWCFANLYFMASGTHYMLEGVDYLSLYGEEPSTIERAFAIYANVIELDADG